MRDQIRRRSSFIDFAPKMATIWHAMKLSIKYQRITYVREWHIEFRNKYPVNLNSIRTRFYDWCCKLGNWNLFDGNDFKDEKIMLEDIYVSLQLRMQNWTTKWHFPLNFRNVVYPGLLLKGLSFSCYRMEISELPNHADLLVLCIIMSK